MLAAYVMGANEVPGEWARWLKAPGVASDEKPIWVSEASEDEGVWLTGKDGSPEHGAINVALKTHNALVHGRASAYLYWQMGDMHETETRYNLLGKANIARPTQSKKYSAFKHFSRYVRPGAVRVSATFGNGTESWGGASQYDSAHALNVSAFLHENDGTLTIVFVNMMPKAQKVEVRVRSAAKIDDFARYLTSETESFSNLAAIRVVRNKTKIEVPAYSVLTLNGNLM
jgi:O-glycosyl hydrolase